MTRKKRTTKLIQPRLQLRLIGSFVGLTAMALLAQFLLLGNRLTAATASIEGAGGELAAEVPAVVLEVAVFSLGILLPVVFGFGVFLTHRIAGPIFRFEEYLRSVARGEQLGPCKLREGDELQSLCDVINDVTEPLRRRSATPREAAGQDQARAAG